uniref:NAC domain-containing protein n=1 Tax=Tanacetum cinerariifolium TaxID=118510 RepID=A0A6L2MKS1_TANCI|nr:hypothetical protein [Tanacetum cinerariifolium]
MTSLTFMCELACQIVQRNLEEKQLEEEQAAKFQNWKFPVCYDDDDDEESSNSLEDNIIFELPPYSAVTPSEPVDSLSIRDEHLNTIPETESDEFIKSCVENLVPNPSESEGENKCDVPAGFTTFSNVLFDADYDFDSGDDQSFSDEDFSKKIYSNPLFDEEIIPIKIDQHPFNAESDLIESMPNHDSSIIISSKIDSLFDEFSSGLTLLKSIPSGIHETDCHPEEEIRLTKRLLYDNSSPRPPEEIVFDNSNANIESFSPSPIPDDDYDSGRDIPILEELLDNYFLSLLANELYHFDIPSPYRPPAKPPDGNTETLNIKMMGDVTDQKGLEAFQPSAECPRMIINGKNTPLLDVPIFHFYPLDQLKIGKEFSGVDTPLFEGMLVEQQAADDTANIAADDVDDVVAEDVAEPTLASPIPTTTPHHHKNFPPHHRLPLLHLHHQLLNHHHLHNNNNLHNLLQFP